MTAPAMPPHFDRVLEELELTRFASLFQEAALPAVAFDLTPLSAGEAIAAGASKLSGVPDLPAGFDWPINTNPKEPGRDGTPPPDRRLDFLLQIDLAAVRPVAEAAGVGGALPADGTLSFFYDLDDQPWGGDPHAQNGFKVTYTPAGTPLAPMPIPPAPVESEHDVSLPECRISFRPTVTFPHHGSAARHRLDERLEATGTLTEADEDSLWEVCARLEHPAGDTSDLGAHRLLGHSWNVQGDMQLRAELISNGVSDADEDRDVRREELAAGADDWVMLLQLASDWDAGDELMWGDLGKLYWWIRREDLAARRFDRVWMTLQCGLGRGLRLEYGGCGWDTGAAVGQAETPPRGFPHADLRFFVNERLTQRSESGK